MGKGKQRKSDGLVFSTQPDWSPEEDDQPLDTVLPNEQLLYVSLNRKQRAGKPVTLVEGYEGAPSGLLELGRSLKQLCGVGGAVKEGCIMVQGDHRNRVVQQLESEGYRVKRKGG